MKHGCAYKKPESQQCCMKRKKGKYCLEHACVTTVCDGFKSDSGDYCDKHRCKLETKGNRCEMERSGGDYCKNHRCAQPECKKYREWRGGYCTKHGCKMPLGDYDYCGNIRKSGSDYCNDHACSVPRCDGIQGTNGSYCIKHGCVMAVIPDVPDLAPNANRSMRARPDDPCVLPKRSPETRYDEQWQNI